MYIEPNSTVILCKNIPFNNNYEATMWFGDAVAQFAFFSAQDKVVQVFQKQSYVRPSGSLGGTIDVKELADNLYNVNYMVFQNTNFGSKWFYAFVTNVEYINNKTTRLTFEIDVMQTWMFDYTLNECFVEREHSATDEIGDNLVDEGLELGDYFYSSYGMAEGFDEGYYTVVATSFELLDDGTFGNADGAIYDNVYSGLKYIVFTNPNSLNMYLAQITADNKSDGIVSIFMIPSGFVVDVNLERTSSTVTNIPKDYNYVGGYVPKNNKLFCHPYQMLCVTDFNGNVGNFYYEYFDHEECSFYCNIAVAPTLEAQIVPLDYKGIHGGQNYYERMVLSSFPQCAFTIDSYRAWVAQNAVPMTANVGSSIVGSIFSGAVSGGIGGAVVGGISSAIGGITNSLAQRHVASTMPPQVNGTPSCMINMKSNTQGFGFYKAEIRYEYAKMIDDYFQKYGYATKLVKVPNTNVRENWTYTKTIGCTISGSLPADDEREICSIYDNGITFFKNEVSFKQQSSLYNRPLSEVETVG